jgi:phosphohistidine phosphatase
LKKLFLIRHCETNQFEENTEDHKKKLNDNGLEDANILNQWFDKNKFDINTIYASSAIRTAETAKLIFNKHINKIKTQDSLYLCSKTEVVSLLQGLDKKVIDVALVGHEPSTSESLKYLIGNFRPDLEKVLGSPYPAGGIAIIYFNIKEWTELDESTGILDAFITPFYLKNNER